MFIDDNEDNDICYTMKIAWYGDLLKKIVILSLTESLFTHKQVLSIFIQVTRALHFVHANANVAHRDIKPENIVFEPNGEVRLIDFGVAKVMRKIDEIEFTTGIKGTLPYMAPELVTKQLRDKTAIDLKASDMWALGVTIYYTLVFKLPIGKVGTET